MNAIKKIFGGDTRQFGMIFALVALIALFQVMTNGLVLKPENGRARGEPLASKVRLAPKALRLSFIRVLSSVSFIDTVST